MLAVILCGGFGKRMGKASESLPKPMTEIDNKNILSYQIEALKKEGIKSFLFITGYLGEKIREYFGDGSDFGVSISYYNEKEPLGTAGALLKMNFEEDFLFINGDIIFDFSLKKMLDFHNKNKALATLFTHPNTHPYDSTLIKADKCGRVKAFVSKNEDRSGCGNLCNAGIQLVSPELLKLCEKQGKADFDKDVIRPAVETGRIYSYKSFEYAKDMGTPERLLQVSADIRSGKVKSSRKDMKQKAVFLDRDGTVNVHKGFIVSENQIELTSKIADGISLLRSQGYLVIVITNQPVVARGDCTFEKLEEIHNRLEQLLGMDGAYLDGIYFCPHHPDSGFENEIKQLKIKCDCRKPQPGLILKAAEDFNVDLSKSFMVGDSPSDIGAAVNAGCIPVFIGNQAANEKDVLHFTSVYDFACYLSDKTKNPLT